MRRCFRPPIPEIFAAARRLNEAVNAHLADCAATAEQLIHVANDPKIRAWTESIWGKRDPEIHRYQQIGNAPPHLPIAERPRPRMPTDATKADVAQRDRRHCRFCGIPVICSRVRLNMHKAYPAALPWGRRNVEQHAAFQCMWMQYDHVLPNSRGGTSGTHNIVVTCAPCNFGRMEFTLEENLLIDPRTAPFEPSWDGFEAWDGLERIMEKR
ncbi:MAG: hypothetical protein JNL81_03290 [Hyphomonadaceae bacterium]|nr:hypothetical protein [Hyphomonadaceae bacterium]